VYIEDRFTKHGLGFMLNAAMVAQFSVYLRLVSMAESKNDVCVLHNLLPENLRLDGPMLVNLKALWVDIRGGEHPGRRTIPDEMAREILTWHCTSVGFGHWYAKSLMEGRPERVDGNQFSCVSANRHVWPLKTERFPWQVGYCAMIHGIRFVLATTWLEKSGSYGTQVAIALQADKATLTIERMRAIQLWILQYPPIRSLYQGLSDGSEASDSFTAYIVIESAELVSLLDATQSRDDGVHRNGAFAKPGFSELLGELLRNRGIPVESIVTTK